MNTTNHMDKQAEEMKRDLANAKVERVGEGIKITFDSGILFETNSSISTVGLGESNSIASNDTVDGRQQNRRVEVAIFANDKLKKAAQEQAGSN